mmetsp:Transcript_25778/g.43213  ORF Transcript_25778/g.43213 Transcript_25778/m.43213 type:complete len:580 (+) Transcript_25778:429-2168(+)
MVGEEVAHVVNLVVEDHPTVLIRLVLRHLSCGQFHSGHSTLRCGSGRGGDSHGGGSSGHGRANSGHSGGSSSHRGGSGVATPLDVHTAPAIRHGLHTDLHGRVEVLVQHADAVLGGRLRVAGDAREQVLGDGGSTHSPVHDTVQQTVTAQPVAPVHASRHLACSIQPRDGRSSGREHLALVIHCQPAHAIVQHRAHDGHVIVVVHVEGRVLEELLPKGALSGSRNLVVLGEGVAERLGVDTHHFGDVRAAAEVLHHPAAHVVLAVPLDLLGGLAVEDEAEGPLVFVHLARDVISAAKLIRKPVPISVDENPAHPSQGLSRKELHLRVWLVRMDQPRGMHLHRLDVVKSGTDGRRHLDSVSSAMLPVGGGQVRQVRSVRVEQRVWCKVGGKTSGAYNDRSIFFEDFTTFFVLHTNNMPSRTVDKLEHFCLGDDSRKLPIGLLLYFLQFLNESVRDGESRKLLLATVRPRHRVSTEARDEGQIQVECRGREPVHGGTALLCKHLDEWRGMSGRVGMMDPRSGFHTVRLKDIWTIRYLERNLRFGESAIDSGSRLRGIAAKECHLIKQYDSPATLQHGVRGA